MWSRSERSGAISSRIVVAVAGLTLEGTAARLVTRAVQPARALTTANATYRPPSALTSSNTRSAQTNRSTVLKKSKPKPKRRGNRPAKPAPSDQRQRRVLPKRTPPLALNRKRCLSPNCSNRYRLKASDLALSQKRSTDTSKYYTSAWAGRAP